ncbi:MAG: hypothetical protein R3E83_10380 [Burkholderiaceae bacterium]
MKPTAVAVLAVAALMAGCAAKATLHGTIIHGRTQAMVPDARLVFVVPETGQPAEVESTLGPSASGETGDDKPDLNRPPKKIDPVAVPVNYVGQYRVKLKAGTYDVKLEHESLRPCAGSTEHVTVGEAEERKLDLCMIEP